MNKQILEENKGRWVLFEQMSPMSSAFIWAALAVIGTLVVLYFFYM